MEDAGLNFDFEQSLDAPAQGPKPVTATQNAPVPPPGALPAAGAIGQSAVSFQKNYKRTVCTYWLRGLCMKGEACGFLHEYDLAKMPVCRNLLKFGVCKEPDCPYKHSMDDIKECNMYKLGFCVYGPACRFKHTRLRGPPPDPSTVEAAKPREVRRTPRDDTGGSSVGGGGYGQQQRPHSRPQLQQQPRPPGVPMLMGPGGPGAMVRPPRPPPPRPPRGPPPGGPPPFKPLPPAGPPPPQQQSQQQAPQQQQGPNQSQQPSGPHASATQHQLPQPFHMQQQMQHQQQMGMMGMMPQGMGMMQHSMPSVMMQNGMPLGLQQQGPFMNGTMMQGMQQGFPQPFVHGFQQGGY